MKAQLIELDEQRLHRYRQIAVVGDLHGDYQTLCSLLRVVDPTKDAIVFLGDYADRGPFGIETIRMVSRLAKKHPMNVILLKGNHEDYTENGEPNFRPCDLRDEVQTKTGNWQRYFKRKLKPFMESLYLAAIIPNEILFVHGGISSSIRCRDDLVCPTKSIERDILWSDPFEGKGERRNTRRGVGVEFGVDLTNSVCQLLGVKKIIRSHEPKKALKGPQYSHDGKVTTISSTNAYGGTPFVLCIDPVNFGKIVLLNLHSKNQKSGQN